jgi:hypothetical protein
MGGIVPSSSDEIGSINPTVSLNLKKDGLDDLLTALGELHASYWGKPLPISMTKLPDEAVSPMDIVPDEDANYDGGLGAGSSGDDAEASGNRPDVLPDVLPEPQVITTGEVFDEKERFFLRAEYIRIYAFLKEIYDKYLSAKVERQPVAVITGQPGIGVQVGDSATFNSQVSGKTFFIRYGLLRCLSEKQRTAYYFRKAWFLFSERGVRCVSPISAFGLKRTGVTWAFIDSSDSPTGIPTDVSGLQTSGIFPIYTTSPSRERWKSVEKSGKKPYLIYMNPWSWEEISIA